MNDHSPPTVPFADLGKADKRAALLRAATEVFAEVGYANATIKRIAARAGTADGTLYNHFANKEALLLGVADGLRQRHDAALASVDFDALAPEDGVRAVVAAVAASTSSALPELKVVVSQALVDAAFATRLKADLLAPMRQAAAQAFALMAPKPVDDVDIDLALRLAAAPALGLLAMRLVGDDDIEARWAEYLQHAARACETLLQQHMTTLSSSTGTPS